MLQTTSWNYSVYHLSNSRIVFLRKIWDLFQAVVLVKRVSLGSFDELQLQQKEFLFDEHELLRFMFKQCELLEPD